MRDGVEHRHIGPIEQQLPGKRRAVERAGVQNGHRFAFDHGQDSLILAIERLTRDATMPRRCCLA